MWKVYHIDACILVSLLDGSDDYHKIYSQLFNRYNMHYLFRITHVAFGETLHRLMVKKIDMDLGRISNRIQHYNIEIRNMPDYNSLKKIMNFIREHDDRLDYNDILIVAAAIADKECSGLITMDSNMIGNQAIDLAAQNYGKKRFIVSDNPFKKHRR